LTFALFGGDTYGNIDFPFVTFFLAPVRAALESVELVVVLAALEA